MPDDHSTPFHLDSKPTPVASRSTRHHRRRVAAAQCVDCGGMPRPGRRTCQACADKLAAYRRERAKPGLCTKCFRRPTTGGKAVCHHCKAIDDAAQARRKEARIEAGVCLDCGVDKAVEDKKTCQRCLAERREYIAQVKEDRKARGVCARCGKNPANNKAQNCETCVIKVCANMNFRSTRRWRELLGILERQRHICPYTGITLIPGENASLDHIVPKCKGGSDDASNLQWIHTRVNFMKSGLYEDEFFDFVATIARHRGLGRGPGTSTS